MAVELMKDVYWVGVADWELRHFHGHELSTHRGSTYNSYLIMDKKITLVDTVWGPYADRLIENIKEIVDPAKIEIVVTNHSESDHSGGLPAIMRLCPNAKVVVSRKGLESVEGHYHQPWNFQAVKTGDKISIGENELIFVEAPMLHWPDSMFTYLNGKKLLMPNDAFGQHYATAFRFNDQVDQNELFEEALKYYANILTPFSDLVLKKIDEVLALGLPVDMIAPSHGVIWRKDPLQIVTKYQEWASQKPEPKAVVVYDTMWDGTRRMADAIGEGLAAAGVQHKIYNASASDRNDIMAEILKARTLVVGAPTVNNGIISTLAPTIEDAKRLRFKNRLFAAFGTYGWSGEAMGLLEKHFEGTGFKKIRDGLRFKWQPREAELEQCRDFGKEIGEATKKA